MSISNAPSVDMLRAAAEGNCSTRTIAELLGSMQKDLGSLPSKEETGGADDVIIIKRHSNRKRGQPRNDEYTQQFNRNCFYQFRNLPETRESFFGIQDDDTSSPGVEKTS